MRTKTIAFIAVWLCVQIVTPAVVLTTSRGGVSPFSWQMFADLPTLPQFWLQYPDASRVEFDMAARAPWARREIDYRVVLPRQVCDSDTSVVAVVVVAPDGEKRYPCQ